jgi:hypothetical protein
MNNLVADRVKENGLIISYLLPNSRNCLAIAHFEKDEDTKIFFKMQNDNGIVYYQSKREYTYLTAYKYVAKGYYYKGMAKGITGQGLEVTDW